MKKISIVGYILLLIFGAANLRAETIDPNNVRPVVLGSSGEPQLGSILDGLFGPSWGSVAGNQQSLGMFRFATNSGTTIPTLVAEYAGYSPINVFGIWFGTDSSNILAVDLLLGPASAGGNAAISIETGRLSVGSSNISNCTAFGGNAINCGTVVNSLITPASFGFYFRTGSGANQYTVDALNPNGEARVLAFQQGMTTNYAFAYEDLPLGSADRDYNDMVVKIESIVAVPEPTTVLLLLAGLAVVAVGVRREVAG